MTYIVADKNFVIADRMIITQEGEAFKSRNKPEKDYSFNFNAKAEKVTGHYNDCNKLYTVPGGKHRGVGIKLVAIAGVVRNQDDMLGALTQGVDFDDYIKVDVNITPSAERRIFNGSTTVFVALEDGKHYIYKESETGGVNETWYEGFAHLGSGSTIVESVQKLLPCRDDDYSSLTALEAFVIASAHERLTVSRNFDTFDLKTGKMIYNRQLTERQMAHILAKIQKKIDLTTFGPEREYRNG